MEIQLKHGTFVYINKMNPDEYKNGGESLTIQYNYFDCLFGQVLVANTDKGICYMAFDDDNTTALKGLKDIFPKAVYKNEKTNMQQDSLLIFTEKPKAVMLHVKGTDFQVKVWEELIKIPMSELTTYGTLAQQINNRKACRAVGSAVGDNPVSFLIPCHRVIQSSGKYGQYHWGPERKRRMIEWEKSYKM